MHHPRMTILFFHASAELYGSDRTLLQLAEGLDSARYRLVVALPREGPLALRLRACGAEVEIGPVGTWGRASLRPRGLLRSAHELPRSVAWARGLMRRHRPDIVHTNTIVVLSGALAARAEGVPHLWHVHEILERPRWIARALASLVERVSTLVVSNSSSTEANLLELNPRLRRKSVVVLNGVRGFPHRPEIASARLAREALGLSQEASWIALIGRINAWKGHGLLLDALAQLKDEHPRARVVMAGDSPPGQPEFASKLEDHIDRLGLRDRVVRLPFQSEVERVYMAADVIVVPSTRPEPFGLVAAEAMSLGRPVVAARHGGLVEIVAEGETGLLFTPGSADHLARALASLLVDPALAQRMGHAARRRQVDLFSVERYCRDFEALYDGLAARHAAETAA